MEIIKRLSAFFREKKDVRAAYLFGSHARGDTGPLSDIDVAILLDKRLSGKERFRIQLKIISDVTEILGTDKVDVVVLNDASLLLKHNAIKEGVVLAESETERVAFEVRIMQEYRDMKYYFDLHAKKALSRIAEGGLA
ncbi:MAG: nucleotidyltransferase domain-containing protein [Candidatus Aenigmarchaeota archaeon]|nr:nucleotidyltransferase domain-containing protein [Candidatus Aenigmarchaeota archaeon]MCK5334018.1 nucleotidyltransferase domain-containing protein [Candidatus Aenigmarchaeota archaeon]